MLSLYRHTGPYRRSALVLLCNGEILGEIVVLQVRGDGFGGAAVQIGLNLPREIEIVRADAVHRPSGPSLAWLAEREEAFAACAPVRRDDHDSPEGRTPPYTALGPYADADDAPHRAQDDDGDDVDDEDDDGPRWGQTHEASSLYAFRRPGSGGHHS
jgi:sRNA-binding carbon storage regulator CsrA